MASQTKVNFISVQWDDRAAMALAGATGNDPTYTLDDLKAEISKGTASLYSVNLEGKQIGFVVLWVEDFGGTKELVIQSGVALRRSRQAVAVTIPALEKFARVRGCSSMRAHLTDGAMIGHLRRGGFHKAEIVMRKAFK